MVQLPAGMRLPLIASVALLPLLAHAGPFTIGVGLGATKSDAAAASSGDTLGLFGRLALSSHWAAQLEVERTDVNAEKGIRAGSALVVVDFRSGSVVPVAFAGLGLDRGTVFDATTDGHHAEAGIGLEFRTPSGVFLGADARLGDLVIDSTPRYAISPLYCTTDGCAMDTLQGGVYHSVRATAGMRF
jgi:hypothetical protein